MDPNETLTRLRGHVEAVQTRLDLYHESHGADVVDKLNNDDLYAIHEAFSHLDSWMTHQNTPPTAWMPSTLQEQPASYAARLGFEFGRPASTSPRNPQEEQDR